MAIVVNSNPPAVIEQWTLPEQRMPHPKNVVEACIFFDKNFKGWYKKVDLSTFENSICAYHTLFSQVFGDFRFDLYRKIFLEEDYGLEANKNPKNPGIFWLKKYEQEWKTEIHKRQNRT